MHLVSGFLPIAVIVMTTCLLLLPSVFILAASMLSSQLSQAEGNDAELTSIN